MVLKWSRCTNSNLSFNPWDICTKSSNTHNKLTNSDVTIMKIILKSLYLLYANVSWKILSYPINELINFSSVFFSVLFNRFTNYLFSRASVKLSFNFCKFGKYAGYSRVRVSLSNYLGSRNTRCKKFFSYCVSNIL